MKQLIDEMHNEVKEVKERNDYFEILIKALDKSNHFKETVIKCLVLLEICTLGVVCYQAYQMANGEYTTTTTEETYQDGAYNFYDSEGNMISSDLSLEEMKELIDLNGGNE